MNEELLSYYAADELAAGAWQDKYALKDREGKIVESTPRDMHVRMAKELARIEEKYKQTPQLDNTTWNSLSHFGRHLDVIDFDFIFKYLDRFKYIIPQGSIMSILGNKYKIGSLSNCFVIPSPLDSYGGIFKTDQQIAQLEKRRGGVGLNINTLRPENTPVLNAAGTSTGAHSFMDRYSNTTREVAQNGRRGALMLLMSCKHPDIFKFVTKKSDLTKVTGANVSTMLTDKFMKAALADEDFYCTFPVDIDFETIVKELEYNKIYPIEKGGLMMKIKARELFDLIIEMAWSNGEPGLAFIDNIHRFSPEGVYAAFRAIASNPCGEQWMQAYDACRLLALNFFSIVVNAFKKDAKIDYDKLYEIAYIQQRLADDIVDLEIEYVDRIITKILQDPEPIDVKEAELDLWKNIKKTAQASRRTGCGFTGLADMLAALGLKYDSPEALQVIEKVMKTKMRAELDCTIDLAILRGTFKGWNPDLELAPHKSRGTWIGKNPFYQMIGDEFPEQALRMVMYGRRNVSWSTVAPTGTTSIIGILIKYANMSAGIEPIFFPWHFRNRKVVAGDQGVRVDYVDKNGDSWQTYPVIMGGFKEWWVAASQYEHAPEKAIEILEAASQDELMEIFKKSPYYGSTANEIDWEKRIEIQAMVQKYTTNAISSTLNLPKDATKEQVAKIYEAAWKKGLKGVTVYRDGCRDGVMNKEAKVKEGGFTYVDAVKRPKQVEAELHIVTVKGVKYGVVIGFVEKKPYEIFAFNLPEEIKKDCAGITTKVKKGVYRFTCPDAEINNLQDLAVHHDETVLTRLISGMMRHGVKPQYILEQIDKCDLEIVSFGKAVGRILKKYVSDDDLIKRNKCKNCGSSNVRMQEGCLTCADCGSSKCG